MDSRSVSALAINTQWVIRLTRIPRGIRCLCAHQRGSKKCASCRTPGNHFSDRHGLPYWLGYAVERWERDSRLMFFSRCEYRTRLHDGPRYRKYTPKPNRPTVCNRRLIYPRYTSRDDAKQMLFNSLGAKGSLALWCFITVTQ